jgi:hypothetical protein
MQYCVIIVRTNNNNKKNVVVIMLTCFSWFLSLSKNTVLACGFFIASMLMLVNVAHALQAVDLPVVATVNKNNDLLVSIPIKLPVGRGGQRPSLSFDYHSSIKSRFAGQTRASPYPDGTAPAPINTEDSLIRTRANHWALSGIPYIGRCNPSHSNSKYSHDNTRTHYQSGLAVEDALNSPAGTKLCFHDGHSYQPLFRRSSQAVYSLDTVGDDFSVMVAQTQAGVAATLSDDRYALIDEVSHVVADFSQYVGPGVEPINSASADAGFYPITIYDQEFGNDVTFEYASVQKTNRSGETVTSGLLPIKMRYSSASEPIDVRFEYSTHAASDLGVNLTGVVVEQQGVKLYEYVFELENAGSPSAQNELTDSYSVVRKCKNKNQPATCDVVNFDYGSVTGELHGVTQQASGAVIEYDVATTNSDQVSLLVNGKRTRYLADKTLRDYRYGGFSNGKFIAKEQTVIEVNAAPDEGNGYGHLSTRATYLESDGHDFDLPRNVASYYSANEPQSAFTLPGGHEKITTDIYGYDENGRVHLVQSTNYHSGESSGSQPGWTTHTRYVYSTDYTIKMDGSNVGGAGSFTDDFKANKLVQVIRSVPSSELEGTYINNITEYRHYDWRAQTQIHHRNYLRDVRVSSCNGGNWATNVDLSAISSCISKSAKSTVYDYNGTSSGTNGGTKASLHNVMVHGHLGYSGVTGQSIFSAKTTYQYGPAGNVTGVTNYADSSSPITASYDYDADMVYLESVSSGPLTTTLDGYNTAFGTYDRISANGLSTHYTYDELGRLEGANDGNGYAVDVSIAPCNGAAACSGVVGASTLVTVGRTGAPEQTTVYNVDGQVARAKTQIIFDAENQSVENLQSDYFYYPNGLLHKVEGPYKLSDGDATARVSNTHYERWGRVKQRIRKLNGATVQTADYRYSYITSPVNGAIRLFRQEVEGNANGDGKKQIATIDVGPLGRKSHQISDGNGVNVGGMTLAYAFDPASYIYKTTTTTTASNSNGLPASLTNVVFRDDFGNVYEEFGSQLGRRYYDYGQFGLSKRYVSSQTSTGFDQELKYDNNGRVYQSIDHIEDKTTNYLYDNCNYGAGRLCAVEELNSNNQPAYVESYGYRSDGLLGSLEKQIAGQGSATNQIKTYDFGFDYNNATRQLVRLTYPEMVAGEDPLQIQYDYNQFGQLDRVSNANADVVYWNQKSRPFFNDTGSFNLNNGGLLSKRETDDRGRTTALEMKRGSSTLRRQGYEYDALSNVTSRTDSHAAFANEAFSYDARNRLTHINNAVTASYGKADNILSVNNGQGVESYNYTNKHTINGSNPSTDLTRLNTVGPWQLDYDEDGYLKDIQNSDDPHAGIMNIQYNGRQKPSIMTPTRNDNMQDTIFGYGGNSLVYLLEAGEQADETIETYFAGKLVEENKTIYDIEQAEESSASTTWQYIYADQRTPVAAVRAMDKSCPAATESAIDSVPGSSLAVMSSPRHGVGNTTVQSASNAKDGIYSTFSETNSNQGSWNVSLNLANDEYLYGIKVHCKSDCSKLRRAHILFSDENLSGKSLVAAKAHSKQEYSFYVKPAINDYWCATLPSPVKAKYLSIRYDDSYNEPVLKLAEVQPYVYSLSTPPNDAPHQFSDPIDEVVTEHNNTIKDALNDAAVTVVAVGVSGTATYVGQTAIRNYLVAGRTASSIGHYIRDAEGDTYWVGRSTSAMAATSAYSLAPQIELASLTGTSARTSMSYLTYGSNATTGATIVTDSYTAGSGISFVAPTITASCAVACTLMVYGDEVDTNTAGTYRQLYVVVDDNGDASEAIHGLYVVNPLGKGQGTITREVWEGISGNSVQNLLDSPNYPDRPNMTEELDQFAAPSDVNNHYGTRIHGYLKVPMAGDYTFWIASDDQSQLLLRDDSRSPSSVTTIASLVSHWTTPFDWNDSDISSYTLTLQAGSYYIYALHKDGGVSDNLAVAWQGPWQVMPTVIDGEYLSPYGAPEQQSATIQGKTGNVVTHSWSSVAYTDTLPDNEVPVLFAQMQTYVGSDPAGERMRSVSATGFQVKLEEGKSFDKELAHAKEVIGYAGFEAGDIVDIYGDTIGEAGTVTMTQASKTSEYTLSFSRQYNHPVVFMQMNTYNGTNPTHMRILSVIGNSARYKQEEWDYLDGSHTTETISYLVLEKGSLLGEKLYRLADGTRLLIGATEVNASWQTVGNMPPDMADIVVLSQPQTVNDASSVVTRMRVRAGEFDLRLQKQEKVGGSKSPTHAHGTETVAYIAIDRVDPGTSEVLNFNDYNLSEYGGDQDKPSTGAVTVEDGGLTLSMNGNRWQKISFPYTIAEDTVLEFDFESTAQGEVQGIGFDNDNSLSSNRIFNVYGSQNYGIQPYRYTGTGNKQHFSIPVGQHFTGNCFNWLVFVHDDDASPYGNAKISNIHIKGGLKEVNCQYAKLTQPNHGFTIQTPDSNYIDIGNEWSVAATVTNINTSINASEAVIRALFRGADADMQLAIDRTGILGLYKSGIGFVRVDTYYNVSAINDGQPHTIAAVSNGIDTFFFVDGVSVGTVQGQYLEGGVLTGSTLINSTISHIGFIENFGRFAEKLDNIQIHNRALTLDETERLAQGETISAGLVAHYTFEGVFPYEDKTDEHYNLVPASGVVLESYPQ